MQMFIKDALRVYGVWKNEIDFCIVMHMLFENFLQMYSLNTYISVKSI